MRERIGEMLGALAFAVAGRRADRCTNGAGVRAALEIALTPARDLVAPVCKATRLYFALPGYPHILLPARRGRKHLPLIKSCREICERVIFANPIEPDLAGQIFTRHLDQHITSAAAVRAQLGGAVIQAAQAIVSAFCAERKVLICGNGGSAADAQHIAAELAGRYETPGRRALPAVALTTDSSALTAISNDLGFDDVFARQVEALGQAGDVLVAISTSGRSPNVLRAVEVANAQGLRTIGLLGCDGGDLLDAVQIPVLVPSQRTAHIQEMHITVGHIFCGLVDSAFAVQQPSA